MQDDSDKIGTDNEIIKSLVDGDRKTFEALFHKYYSLLCDYACAFGKQGQAVITKYVQRLGVDNSEFERKISTRVDAILTDLSRR